MKIAKVMVSRIGGVVAQIRGERREGERREGERRERERRERERRRK